MRLNGLPRGDELSGESAVLGLISFVRYSRKMSEVIWAFFVEGGLGVPMLMIEVMLPVTE